MPADLRLLRRGWVQPPAGILYLAGPVAGVKLDSDRLVVLDVRNSIKA
jgi:hypothetical protein